MHDTRRDPPVPLELLQFQTATRRYLAAIEEARTWAEIEADVNRIARPNYAGRLDELIDDLRVALDSLEQGTPARVSAIVATLVGLAEG